MENGIFDESKRRPDDYDGVQAEAASFDSGVTQQTSEMDEESKKRLTAMRGAGVGLIRTLDSYAGSAGDSAAMRSVQTAAQRFADQYADYNKIDGGVRADVMLDRNGDFHVRLGRKADGFPVAFDFDQMEASLRKDYMDEPQQAKASGPAELLNKDGSPMSLLEISEATRNMRAADRRALARQYGLGDKFFEGDETALNDWIGDDADPDAKMHEMLGKAANRAQAIDIIEANRERIGDKRYQQLIDNWTETPAASGGSSRRGGTSGVGSAASIGGEVGTDGGATGGKWDSSDISTEPSSKRGKDSEAPVDVAGQELGMTSGVGSQNSQNTTPDEQETMEQLQAKAAKAGNYEVDEMEWDSKKGKFVPKPLARPWNVRGAESAVRHHVSHPDNKTVSFSLPSSNDTTKERGVETTDVRGGVHTAREILNRMGIDPDHGDSYVLTNEQYEQVLEVVRSGVMPDKPQTQDLKVASGDAAVATGEGGAEAPEGSVPAAKESHASAKPDENPSELEPYMVGQANLRDEKQLAKVEQNLRKQGFVVREVNGEYYMWHPQAKVWMAADGHTVVEQNGTFVDSGTAPGKLQYETDGASILKANGPGGQGDVKETKLRRQVREDIPENFLKYLAFKNGANEEFLNEEGRIHAFESGPNGKNGTLTKARALADRVNKSGAELEKKHPLGGDKMLKDEVAFNKEAIAEFEGMDLKHQQYFFDHLDETSRKKFVSALKAEMSFREKDRDEVIEEFANRRSESVRDRLAKLTKRQMAKYEKWYDSFAGIPTNEEIEDFLKHI